MESKDCCGEVETRSYKLDQFTKFELSVIVNTLSLLCDVAMFVVKGNTLYITTHEVHRGHVEKF